jgi:hypothetical protein
MGIVKISEQMHDNLRVASEALSRSINAQAEHWLRIGMLSELHPGLTHAELCQLLVRASQNGDGDLLAYSGIVNNNSNNNTEARRASAS